MSREETKVHSIDESRMAERPEGVTEDQWRAKLVYEAVQHEQAETPEAHLPATDSAAKEAADKVRRGRKR